MSDCFATRTRKSAPPRVCFVALCAFGIMPLVFFGVFLYFQVSAIMWFYFAAIGVLAYCAASKAAVLGFLDILNMSGPSTKPDIYLDPNFEVKRRLTVEKLEKRSP